MAHRDDVSLGLHPNDLLSFTRGTHIQMAVPADWNLQLGDTIDWECEGPEGGAVGTAEVVGLGRKVEEGVIYNSFKWIS